MPTNKKDKNLKDNDVIEEKLVIEVELEMQNSQKEIQKLRKWTAETD